jgi:hypothetical protein
VSTETGKKKKRIMECQAEAAALLPSFRELTSSAGVVGRDRNGSPSDGSTDGSQQSQVPLLKIRFTCTRYFRLM